MIGPLNHVGVAVPSIEDEKVDAFGRVSVSGLPETFDATSWMGWLPIWKTLKVGFCTELDWFP